MLVQLLPEKVEANILPTWFNSNVRDVTITINNGLHVPLCWTTFQCINGKAAYFDSQIMYNGITRTHPKNSPFVMAK